MRRSADTVASNPHDLCRFILDRRNHFLKPRVPPLVAHDPVAAAVCSCKKCGVPRSSVGISVVVMAVGEICTMIHEQLESTLTELIAIAFEVVCSELVNNDNNN